MKDFSVLLFLPLLTLLAHDVCCKMNPSNLGLQIPPSPQNVEFDDCFVVRNIDGRLLDLKNYQYNHICPEKVPYGTSIPAFTRSWYLVASSKGSGSTHKYEKIVQFQFKVTYMKSPTLRFVMKHTDYEITITFQSIEQIQLFYRMVYGTGDVVFHHATEHAISKLHEITSGYIGQSIASDVRMVYDQYDADKITVMDTAGNPYIVFSTKTAAISKPDKEGNQLILRVNADYYLCTLSNHNAAEAFGNQLMQRGFGYMNQSNIPDHINKYYRYNRVGV